MNPSVSMMGADSEVPVLPSTPTNVLRHIGVSMIPFTPVSFEGPDLPYALLRLAVYGSAAYMSWNRSRKLSYVLIGSAAVCATTSALGGVWKKHNGEL